MNGINKVDAGTLINTLDKKSSDSGEGFGKILEDSIEKVNELQKAADKSVEEVAEGKSDNIIGTVIALEKADQSLKLMTEVRNKVVEAYNQIMRMQV